MKPPDCFGEKRRSRQDIDLVAYGPGREPERRHGIGNDEPLDGGIGQNLGGPGHEQAVRHERNHPACPGLHGPPARRAAACLRC